MMMTGVDAVGVHPLRERDAVQAVEVKPAHDRVEVA
jgi:hypothetical protein